MILPRATYTKIGEDCSDQLPVLPNKTANLTKFRHR